MSDKRHTDTPSEVVVSGLTPKGKFLLERYDQLLAAGIPAEQAARDAQQDAEMQFGRKP